MYLFLSIQSPLSILQIFDLLTESSLKRRISRFIGFNLQGELQLLTGIAKI